MKKRRERRRAPPDPAPAAPEPPLTLPPGLQFALLALLLLAVAIALYWMALRYPPVFDDAHNVRDLTSKSFAARIISTSGLRWLSDASFGLVHALFGGGLFWQRIANVVLHAGTAILLYGFFSRLFRAVLDDPRARWMALAGALLFLLHPVAVYGVAYLIERSIIMATLFSALALWCVLEGLLRRSVAWYAGAAVAYLLAVSAKEHAVMMPAVAAALVLLMHGASLALARRIAWVFALFAVVGVAAVLRLRGVLGTAYEPFASDLFAQLGAARGDFDTDLAYPLSVMNQATLFFRYLLTWLLPWPGWMSVDVRTVFPRELVQWPYWAGFAAWIAYPVVAVCLLLKRGRLGLLGFGLLYPWLFALTEMVTVRVQEPFVLYRSYLWMSGLPAIVPALAGIAPAARWRVGIVAIACVAFTVAALERLDTFSTPLKLWNDVVSKNAGSQAPLVERGHIARGYVHFDSGRLDEAGADFERALEINPHSPDALVARASLKLQRERYSEAITDTSRAIDIDPRYGSAYDKRCAAKMGLGQAEDALKDCRKAVTLDPRNHEAWINTGALYHRWLKRPEEAATAYVRALQLDPENGVAHFNYAMLLFESGRRDEIVRYHVIMGCKGGVRTACKLAAGKQLRLPPGAGK